MTINYPNMARTMVAFLLPFGLQTIEASAAVRGEQVSGTLLVEPDTAPPGTKVEITGQRLSPGTSIAISLDGSDVCRG